MSAPETVLTKLKQPDPLSRGSAHFDRDAARQEQGFAHEETHLPFSAKEKMKSVQPPTKLCSCLTMTSWRISTLPLLLLSRTTPEEYGGRASSDCARGACPKNASAEPIPTHTFRLFGFPVSARSCSLPYQLPVSCCIDSFRAIPLSLDGCRIDMEL